VNWVVRLRRASAMDSNQVDAVVAEVNDFGIPTSVDGLQRLELPGC